jgi:hypothetical protein
MKTPVRPDKDRILLIGRRKGARAAAQRCGWTPLVIDVPARIEQTPGGFGGAIAATLEQAIDLCGNRPPVAVAAVATGSVVAAAAIRAHYGIQGVTPEVALRCHDKLVMKKAIAAAGLPCAPWLETDTSTSPRELIDRLGLPLVLKLPISSGGRGVMFCHTAADVGSLLRPGLLAESYVAGTEMSIESFRSQGRTVFRNHTRYLVPRWASILPARLDTSELAANDALAERVHDALGIECGITHMEIFLTADGPVFGEIAARPPGGYLMELMRRAYGFDPWDAVLRLAAGETPEMPRQAHCTAGVWMIYPPPGKIRTLHGLAPARAMPGVVDLQHRLKPGDHNARRYGSGDSKGCLLVEAGDHETCATQLTAAAAIPAVTVGDNTSPVSLCGREPETPITAFSD